MLTIKVMRCKICEELIPSTDMKEHLVGHNPNAETMDCEEVREQFTWIGTAEAVVNRLDVLDAIDETFDQEDHSLDSEGNVEAFCIELRKKIMELP